LTEISIPGEPWPDRVQSELDTARLIVVLWGAEARRSEWVQKEALAAQESGRLVQIHATGLPLLPPFDKIQEIKSSFAAMLAMVCVSMRVRQTIERGFSID
jgi:hypothetical protein